jgi:hypothetical protein
VLNHWKRDALLFASKIGTNSFEQTIERCLGALKKSPGKRRKRRDIARIAHVDKRTLDSIQATLIDRGDIELLEERNANNVPTLYWAISGG